MKKHAASIVLVVIEVVAILLAVFAAAAIYLYWRLNDGPISLNLFRAGVESTIEDNLPPGFAANIENVALQREPERALISIDITNLAITDSGDENIAFAPRIKTVIGLGDLFVGKIGPRTVDASGANFKIVRNENQNVEIPIVSEEATARQSGGVLARLLGHDILERAFEKAELSDATVEFFDVASGRSWVAPGSRVIVERVDTGLRASLRGDVRLGAERAGIEAQANYDEQDRLITVNASGTSFPIGDILTMFYGDRAAVLDAPVTGGVNMTINTDGDIMQSSFTAQIIEGALYFGERRAPINLIALNAAFDPESNKFDIDQFEFDVDGSKGSINGDVQIFFGDDIRTPQTISFELGVDDLIVDTKAFLPAPIPVQTARLVGNYALSERALTLDHLAIALFDSTIAGDLRFQFPGRDVAPGASVGILGSLDVDGALNQNEILSIWPYPLASGARDWVRDRLISAVVTDLTYEIDLGVGAIQPDGGLPDESMLLSFAIDNASAEYVEKMTPLHGGRGKGVLRGNSFVLNVEDANVKGAKITSGSVEFPEFMPKHQPSYIRFSIEGASETLLGILDEEPLAFLSQNSLSPSQFIGEAAADVVIMRPNKEEVLPEEYTYDGKATFKNMQISNLIGEIELSDAVGEVDIETEQMTITGTAALAGETLDIEWVQKFTEGTETSHMSMSGVVDSTTADLFGVATRQFLTGPVDLKATAVGDLGSFKRVEISADFANTVLSLDTLGWRKPRGAAALGNLTIVYNEDDIEVRDIRIVGDGVDVAGDFRIGQTGRLIEAMFPTFRLRDRADLRLSATRNVNEALSLTALGPFVDLGPFIESAVEQEGGRAGTGDIWGDGLLLTGRIDKIALRRGINYNVTSLDFWHDSEQIQRLEFSAFDDENMPLTLGLSLTGDMTGSVALVEARSGQIGTLLNGLLGIRSIDGGEGTLVVEMPSDENDPYKGKLRAQGLTVSNAPLLARLFAAGSLDGLGSLLSNKGIDFTRAYSEFEFNDGVLTIEQSRATGPSVGITANGGVALGSNGKISLVGAVAPLYQINSILGNAPLIGDLFVGKKGEGLLALSYSIDGETTSPTIFINPLSALTPGVFRQMFQQPGDVIVPDIDEEFATDTAPPVPQ